ncbi:hypothetical protein Hanom_Chr12g01097081 [Helianthus anomalus]
MNGRNKKNGIDIGKIGDLSIKYRTILLILLVPIYLTNILYRYLGWGPITDISLIYRLIYRDINYIADDRF